MKKILLIVVIVGGLAFTSCTKKRDYICTCTTTLSFFGQTTTPVSVSSFKNVTEEEAEEKCEDLVISGSDTTCTLSED